MKIKKTNMPTTPKIYLANLSQIGTDAPSENIFINTIGEGQWQYDSEGTYNLIITGGFPDANKIVFFASSCGIDKIVIGYQSDENTFQINVGLATGGYSIDNGLSNTSIRIEVYP